MSQIPRSVELTPEEIELIQSALHTQEKILSVQSRATKDNKLSRRLNDLQGVLSKLGRQNRSAGSTRCYMQPTCWPHLARSLFS